MAVGEMAEVATGESTAPLVESALLWAFLAIRAVHLVQGALCVASGWSTYRRPRLAAAVLGGVGAESMWLILRSANRRDVDQLAARVEALTGAGGLLGLAAATWVEDRTTSLNWMLPFTVSSTAPFVLGVGRAESLFETATLASAYLGTSVRPGTRPGQVVTAMANAASYAGFYAVSAAVVRRARREGAELDATRAESAARGERLAIERERNRQHRLLHDSALQTLEAIGNGLIGLDDSIRSKVRSEAGRLRQALAGIEPEGDLAESLGRLVADFAAEGLEVTHSIGGVRALLPATTAALIEAVREALRNVIKHANIPTAVIRADASESGVKVTIRDHGRGFDPEKIGPGFGLVQSVSARLAEVDGTVEVWSKPGRGTRVTLWVPVA